ncbi:MFS transporter [Paenibacillus sp. L3-i20]|uniref:staphylopine family metallophore export MFS transporter CntE n=1 Tax=Paenibacillus sp. L3-i20 TaxID=2905833 RepID=UPI001EDEB05D|nr:MFS transporter [Paenibacillus sp. L3-i20]GKU78923.1 MFS transporter [Paenibacillus sp. L3-i20]
MILWKRWMKSGSNSSIAASPPFLKLYLVTFLFFSANPIINIVLPIYSEAAGAGNAEIGVMMGAYLMVSMLFRPWAGAVVSRYGALKVLRILLIGNVIVLGMYAVVGLEWFVVVRGLQGLLTAFFSLSLQMGIVDSLPEKERAQGISLYLLAGMLPTVIGPLIAWSLWDIGGMQAFTISILIIAVTTIALGYKASVPGRPLKREKVSTAESASRKTMRKSLIAVVGNRFFLVCSIVMLVASIGFGTVTTFVVLYVKQIGNGNPGLFFMLQAGMMVAARFVLRSRIPSDGKWHPVLTSSLLFCLAAGIQFLSLAALGPTFLMYIASLLIGLGMAIIYPLLITYLTFVLSDATRNVLVGLFIAMSDLGVVLGNIIMGSVADKTSYSFMFMLCAVLALITGVFVLVTGVIMHKDAETKSI